MLEQDLDLDFTRHKSTTRRAATAGKVKFTEFKGGEMSIQDMLEDDQAVDEKAEVTGQQASTAKNQPFVSYQLSGLIAVSFRWRAY